MVNDSQRGEYLVEDSILVMYHELPHEPTYDSGNGPRDEHHDTEGSSPFERKIHQLGKYESKDDFNGYGKNGKQQGKEEGIEESAVTQHLDVIIQAYEGLYWSCLQPEAKETQQDGSAYWVNREYKEDHQRRCYAEVSELFS